jgi:hypothetical protein
VKIERFLATFPKREYRQIRANLWRVAQPVDDAVDRGAA